VAFAACIGASGLRTCLEISEACFWEGDLLMDTEAELAEQAASFLQTDRLRHAVESLRSLSENPPTIAGLEQSHQHSIKQFVKKAFVEKENFSTDVRSHVAVTESVILPSEPSEPTTSLWQKPFAKIRDIFGNRPGLHIKGEHQVLGAPAGECLVLLLTVVLLLMFDAFVLQRWKCTGAGHLAVLGFWFGVAVLYNIRVVRVAGSDLAVQWCTGYLLEWMLSLDNLFVFHLVFKVYKTPDDLMHRALFLGLIGAVLFRMFFFLAMGTLVHLLDWVRVFFGFILIWSGFQAVVVDEDEGDPSDTKAVKTLRWLLGSRLQETYDTKGGFFFAYDDSGRLCVTLLAFVVLTLEATDILFAVDSVTAKVGQISNQYIAYSSSVIAMPGLRAMFFVIQDLVTYFELLKYGLCIILVFIGAELVLSPWMQLSSATACVVIFVVFAVSTMVPLVKGLLDRPQAGLEPVTVVS